MLSFFAWLYAAICEYFLPSSPDAPPASRNDSLRFSVEESSGPSSEVNKTLYITSHDRHTPLSPPPNLQYDLRFIPNPPLSLRETHTGHSRHIRDGLSCEPRFREILNQAQSDIRGAVETAEKRRDGKEGKDISIRVGCLCGSGHHRSVAFSEQLAQMEWPKGWKLELTHRDLVPEVKKEKARERKRRRP
ncbi:uncharacterized protein F4822DRAFT_442540 [Hypoxylon trugodes]|uniref:uncharacterized protein n=1 Tax=Hypoxylon trugodes TaxID=326681 RepID=UPI0021990EFB|nr:uncharacterized protein F4822DRAFT_442540 [Hypoxylon trugodes]KAI1391595.1 hypothetical protein F4822DRAFT_442540 [Hypoxylon trugodes]